MNGRPGCLTAGGEEPGRQGPERYGAGLGDRPLDDSGLLDADHFRPYCLTQLIFGGGQTSLTWITSAFDSAERLDQKDI